VKSVPQGCRRGVLPENRCITVFLIFLGAIAAELSSVWVVLATLLVASTVGVGNCVKRMARFYTGENRATLEMSHVITPIDSG
jgi:hypothetical protein